MKKLFLSTAMLCCFLLSSCTKESKEEEQLPKVNPLVGTWIIQSLEVGGNLRELNQCDRKNKAIFADTTFKLYFNQQKGQNCNEQILNWTYTTSDNGIIFAKSEAGLAADVPFTLNENLLTLNYTIGNMKVKSIFQKQ